jgi:hypothetical protein
MKPSETPLLTNPPLVFTLRLGAEEGKRPDEFVVVKLIRESGVESFSLSPCEGWFRGEGDPGWAIMIGSERIDEVVRVAEVLRAGFRQEGVGIEVLGRYLRVREEHGPEAVAAEIWGLRHGFHPAYALTVFRAEGVATGWPESFVIITAYATTGETWGEARNVAADAELRARLKESGKWCVRLIGEAPDGGHAEPGWAVEMGEEEARRIGREFAQDAIYSVRAGVLFVLSCRGDGAAEVGLFEPRLTLTGASD